MVLSRASSCCTTHIDFIFPAVQFEYASGSVPDKLALYNILQARSRWEGEHLALSVQPAPLLPCGKLACAQGCSAVAWHAVHVTTCVSAVQ